MRVFTVSEHYGPLRCSVNGCRNPAFAIYLPDDEYDYVQSYRNNEVRTLRAIVSPKGVHRCDEHPLEKGKE